jgi:hypothetical protein
MDIPVYIARAINNEIENIQATTHILTKTINLHETSSIVIPYSSGITWTSIMINWPNSLTIPVEMNIGTLNTNICTMKLTPAQWHHFRWPIPSIDSVDPLTVTINCKDAPCNLINIKVLGYDNLLPVEIYYVMFDENGVATVDIRNTDRSSKPKGYHLFAESEHITCVEDYEIYPTSVYLDRYDEGLYSDESE